MEREAGPAAAGGGRCGDRPSILGAAITRSLDGRHTTAAMFPFPLATDRGCYFRGNGAFVSRFSSRVIRACNASAGFLFS